jgi:hypothetical protein
VRIADSASAAATAADIDPTTTAQIPVDIRAALTPQQIARLERMLAVPTPGHTIDYRVSTALLGRRFYLTLFSGRELRSPRRVTADGQQRSFLDFLFEALLLCLAVTFLACLLAVTCLVLLYLVKSALGVDLFDGPSFLHRFFFD